MRVRSAPRLGPTKATRHRLLALGPQVEEKELIRAEAWQQSKKAICRDFPLTTQEQEFERLYRAELHYRVFEVIPRIQGSGYPRSRSRTNGDR